MTLVRVEAPHFVAGLVIEDGRCIEAAPILRWAIGKSESYLRSYIRRRAWRASVVATLPIPSKLFPKV